MCLMQKLQRLFDRNIITLHTLTCLHDSLFTEYSRLSAAGLHTASRTSGLTGNERHNCNLNCTSYALFVSAIIIHFKQHFYIRTRLAGRLIPVRTEILVNGETTL